MGGFDNFFLTLRVMQNDVFFEDHALLTLTLMVMKYDFS